MSRFDDKNYYGSFIDELNLRNSKKIKKIIKLYKKIAKSLSSCDGSRPDSWDLGAIYKYLCSKNLLKNN